MVPTRVLPHHEGQARHPGILSLVEIWAGHPHQKADIWVQGRCIVMVDRHLQVCVNLYHDILLGRETRWRLTKSSNTLG